MKLLIEHGQLLKPYIAPYDTKTQSHRKPAGWTPGRTPAMRASYDVLKVIHPDIASHVIWEQIETDEAERLQGKPWLGWVPTVYGDGGIDQEIGSAYRKLYFKMKKYPPDGEYVYEGGEMRSAGKPLTPETFRVGLETLRGGTGEGAE